MGGCVAITLQTVFKGRKEAGPTRPQPPTVALGAAGVVAVGGLGSGPHPLRTGCWGHSGSPCGRAASRMAHVLPASDCTQASPE